MASKKKSTFASAQAALSKAMQNMEDAISNMVGAKTPKKKKAPKRKAKKARRKSARR